MGQHNRRHDRRQDRNRQPEPGYRHIRDCIADYFEGLLAEGCIPEDRRAGFETFIAKARAPQPEPPPTETRGQA